MEYNFAKHQTVLTEDDLLSSYQRRLRAGVITPYDIVPSNVRFEVREKVKREARSNNMPCVFLHEKKSVLFIFADSKITNIKYHRK
jgi:hypothetical protein